MKVNWDDFSNTWKDKHVPNCQADVLMSCDWNLLYIFMGYNGMNKVCRDLKGIEWGNQTYDSMARDSSYWCA